MILLIGGAFQGQVEFAVDQLGIKDSRIYKDFHMSVKEWLRDGSDIEAMTNQILNGPYDAIASDEIGMGIVPLDKEDRAWREETGRALTKIAKESDQVYRVFCGIGNRIK